MFRFLSVCLSAWIGTSALPGTPTSAAPVDLNALLVTISLDGADVFAGQDELNRKLPNILVNLEFDQRDAAERTLQAAEIPLQVLDSVGRTFHSKWTFDVRSRSISFFPSEAKRDENFPFELMIPAPSVMRYRFNRDRQTCARKRR